MKVGVLGSGGVAQTLATGFLKHGHQVTLGSRTPDKLKDWAAGNPKGKTGTFFLPKRVMDMIKEGMELGEADDIVFGMTNSKQENGAVGILTGNVITRTELYKAATVLSLIPFRNTELY